MHRPAAALLALLLLPAAAAAQAARDTIACPAPRSYAACALRVEPTFWSGTRVLRGTAATTVDRIEGFNASRLARIVAGSDSAVVQARGYQADAGRAMVFGLIGGLLVGAATSLYLDDGDSVASPGVGLLVGGAASTLVGAGFQLRAQKRLARAVWWYNHDVAASP